MNRTQLACIFDLDGVLVDTAVYHYQAWRKLANSLGFDFSVAQNEQLKGVNRQRSLEKILGWGGLIKTANEQEALAALKNSWYVDMIDQMTAAEVLPGAISLLEELLAAGIPVGLGSASKNAQLILERTDLTRFFTAIVDGNLVSSSKPDPEVFLKAAELLGRKPEECIVFEDAAAGVEAALAANMQVAGIGSAKNLPGAGIIVETLTELNLELLRGLSSAGSVKPAAKNKQAAAAWSIIEETFDPARQQIAESIFSLGNGRMGQRANFEETYTGESLSGNYVAGIYYPDKTRVGWWKNGYPEYFAKVLNACNWMGLQINLGGTPLDLHTATVKSFRRELQMKAGYLQRNFQAVLPGDQTVEVQSKRFFSIANDEIAAFHYQLKAVDFTADLELRATIDGAVSNQDANYGEKFWDEVSRSSTAQGSFLTLKTKKTGFEVITGVKTLVWHNGKSLELKSASAGPEKCLVEELHVKLEAGDILDIYKIATNLSSQNYTAGELPLRAAAVLKAAVAKGFNVLLEEQAAAWALKWEEGDIQIEGDIAAQQAIRFNIFQLNQTYTGKDARLNIGPKGFTGEKYGGSTYWDTEAYCIPFYLATANQEVARNLLIYRYNHLAKAIENAQKLGFDGGAALYPMVTMNGEECHNEWEITFEEIHRNGAIAFAIYNYIRYTGDQDYLKLYGLEVLIGIARFWKQRVNWSVYKQQYVMLGVTGPNEYENNVNNNWYTSTMAVWCLDYAMEAAGIVGTADPQRFAEIIAVTGLKQEEEFADWKKIVAEMYLPEDQELGIFLQQDGYLDKEQILVSDLPAAERPINQQWSWDRILRSCLIKQADVLQGMYFLEDRYDLETLGRNFAFYEARTVHESSLSPCVHSILAARLNDGERAYEFYLRTARLDLDNYNNDTGDGLHITSMAGTWMSIVEGFAGMRVRDNQLSFRPFLPGKWQSFAFQIGFRGTKFRILLRAGEMTIRNMGQDTTMIRIYVEQYPVPPGETTISYPANQGNHQR